MFAAYIDGLRIACRSHKRLVCHGDYDAGIARDVATDISTAPRSPV